MADEMATPSLQVRIGELEAKQSELLALVESKEYEFGKKRAQFKELFLQKETELNDHISKLRLSTEENEALLAELKKVSSERDNLKTAVLITKTSSDDQYQAMKSKYQEEITSLKAIMQDAVHETRQETVVEYEKEQHRLTKANLELETKLAKYKTQLKELKSKSAPENDDNEGLFDVLSPPWKRPSTPEDNGKETDENLEESMKKAQENAETLRAIVMPLEEEIATLRSKLKNANEKISVFEAKEKKQSKSQSDTPVDSNTPTASVEELEEKVKELSQYLEAERSSRTDLEMFVAVLNTQKGVLQEDADKLRRELHNVCRLLEQEKEEHVALEDTWKMANDRFLETQRVQRIEQEKIRQLLTAEQQELLQENRKEIPEPVELLTPPSPATRSKFLHRKTHKEPGNKLIKTRKITAADAKRTLSSLVRGQKNNTPSQSTSILDADIPSIDVNKSPLLPITTPTTTANGQASTLAHHEMSRAVVDHNEKPLSDSESSLVATDKTMKKYKSADDLERDVLSGPAITSRSKSHDFNHGNLEKSSQLEEFVAKHGKEKIDWKGFQEATKSSYSDDTNRSCAMCSNYEKQLQNLQGKYEGIIEEMSALAKQLKEEQETVVVVKRAHAHLEQSIKMASEDAQAQITAASETQRNLENMLKEVNIDIANVKNEAAQKMKEIMESRDSLMARCEQLAENFKLSKNQNETDQPLGNNTLQAYKAASRTQIDKLQSEIHFMKDRIMAEQVAKENLEEFFQGDISKLESEIKKLHRELELERQRNQQLGQQPQFQFEGNASNEVIAVLEKQLQQASKEKTGFQKQIQELKSQIHSLNSQLNSSESVQRDFVKLSQSLQMELEEIKEYQKEIKWELEDDVYSCRKCEKDFDVGQEKHHCKQCGRIFCHGCSSRTINSPGSQKPLRVCVDCYETVGSDVFMDDGKLKQEPTVDKQTNDGDDSSL